MKPKIQIKDKEFELYMANRKILRRVKQLAKQISHDFFGKEPLFLISMNGALTFSGEFMHYITIPYKQDSIRVKSYEGTQSTGKITIEAAPKNSLKGHHVIITEDIVDTGLTIDYLIKYAKDHGAASVHTVSLLSKKATCIVEKLHLDYVGFIIPDRFVVGHGFDYDESGRYLHDIYALVGGAR